ncbi:Plant UBX domain-containing protein 16 [Cardamine amara subsp. amara]|uniref:Plant UBX domain-containing protein 16 n=1 Tax=Cardamine amara subsp. amara TaxID=228776 RepID=A0ABD0ZUH0_CARAN
MGANFSTIKQLKAITTRLQLHEEIDLFRQTIHQDQLISSFLEIVVDQTNETARDLLQSTNWNIDEAVNLLFTNNNNYDPSMHQDNQNEHSATSGTFEDAKSASVDENRWLIVNLLSNSCMLNRDLLSNEVVLETVKSNFLLWQVYDHTIEGKKIPTYYKIDFASPVVLVIDPITGQKMRMWSGEVEVESFVEELKRFMDYGPHEYISSVVRNRFPETKETCLSSHNTYRTTDPSWGEEFEDEDAYSSGNYSDQDYVPYSDEEEDTCLSDEEFEKEDSCLESNTDQVVAPSSDEGFEKEETCSESNNTDQIMAPSWGEEFEKEDTCSSRNNTAEIMAPSLGNECEEISEIVEEETCLEKFPALTEEPKEDRDRSLVCSLCVRFPDGRRKQRKFLKNEPIQLLWSFCDSHEKESKKRAFKLVHAIPGASKTLDYRENATFHQSGLANSIISVTWE